MKIFNNTKNVFMGLLIAAALVPFAVSAKNYEARESLDRKSREKGISTSSLSLLERIPGAGNQDVAEKILKRFKGKNDPKKTATFGISDDAEYLVLKEPDQYEIREKNGNWKIKVWVDGTRFHISDYDYIDTNKIEKIPVEKRFSNEKLEKIGRKYIKDHLADFVETEFGEEIVPLWTEFELMGAESEDGQKVTDMVNASKVYFGRKIDGIDIVGGGSKISLTVANDGAVIDVMVDWPKYQRSSEIQEIVGIGEIMERLSVYGKKDKSVNKVKLNRFECGYYDPGAKYTDVYGFVQSGCVAIVTGDDAENAGNPGFRVISAIPSGKTVEWDDNWPEAKAILDDGDLCEETDLSEYFVK